MSKKGLLFFTDLLIALAVLLVMFFPLFFFNDFAALVSFHHQRYIESLEFWTLPIISWTIIVVFLPLLVYIRRLLKILKLS